jgi:GNAT superfamily N-acetyltransferase
MGWRDPQQYLEAFPRFARAFGGGAIDHGTAQYYQWFSGVAFWLPPGGAPDEESLTKVVENTVADERKAAMFSMFEQRDALHPQEAHWHLPLIGVDPAHQGKGIGSALLSHILNLCDGQNVSAYLEATSPRNARLYERHGFEVIGSIQVADSPRIIAMLRQTKTDVLTTLVNRVLGALMPMSALFSHGCRRMLQSVRQAVQRIERRRLLEG